MDDTQRTSTWRDKYKVHPAAYAFPMMSDEELRDLGQDIKRNGLKHPIILQHNADERGAKAVLLDGRNRLEAMERAGIDHGYIDKQFRMGDPVAHIISANLRRRHLTSGQLAAVLVKLAEIEVGKETGSSEPVSESKGGRGPKVTDQGEGS